MGLNRYMQLVERRRSLRVSPFKTLADVGFDGPWVTPYQKASCSQDGPVLLAMHWLDEPSIRIHRDVLLRYGYLPTMGFNRVMDIALSARNMQRCDIYVTQAFHLVPTTRSEAIPSPLIDESFEAVTRHELTGRKVLALGDTASRTCRRHGVAHVSVCHPSRRGYSFAQNAAVIAKLTHPHFGTASSVACSKKRAACGMVAGIRWSMILPMVKTLQSFFELLDQFAGAAKRRAINPIPHSSR